MQEFRLNFVDHRGAIAAHDTFACDSDVTALLVADRLLDACAEVYQAYELWCGARRVASLAVGGHHGAVPGGPIGRHLARAVQETVLERERILLDSQASIARSQRLVAATNKLLADLAKGTQRTRP